MGGEAAIRRVLDGALDAVVATDRSGSVVGWDKAAEGLFGWTRDEVLGQRVQDLIVPARERERFARRFRAIVAGEVRTHIEGTAVDRHGRELPIEIGAAASETDGCIVATAFIRDISERKRAERLRDTEHRVARLLATGPSGRDLSAACQPILGEGLGWPAVEGYMLVGTELKLVARWGGEARAPVFELAERARRRGGVVVEPGALAVPIMIDGEARGVTVLRGAPDREAADDEVAVMVNITRALEQYGERRLAEWRLDRETIALAEVARATPRPSLAPSSGEAPPARCGPPRPGGGAAGALPAPAPPRAGGG